MLLTILASMQTCINRRLRLEASGGQLFPGIPDDITLNQIAPKLTWRVFHILSAVSPAWRDAIRTHRVYDARVKSHSTETLVLMSYSRRWGSTNVIAVYSLRDKCSYELPPIPYVRVGIPRWCQCVALDGKIYVLGGAKKNHGLYGKSTVYVFDLTGQGRWKECESMREPRQKFGCGVIDGRIYVFGGIHGRVPLCRSEVYNPKEDIWFPISSLNSRFRHVVATVGEELFVHRGMSDQTCGSRSLEMHYGNWMVDDDCYTSDVHRKAHAALLNFVKVADFVEVYNPVMNQWRLESGMGGTNVLFTGIGKLHSMSRSTLLVLHAHENISTSLQGAVRRVLGEHRDTVEVSPVVTLVVGDELLAIVYCQKSSRYFLVHSLRGFGSDEEIVWHEAQISGQPFSRFQDSSYFNEFLHPIQL